MRITFPVVLCLAACGTDVVLDQPDAGSGSNSNDPGYLTLVDSTWTLNPNSEKFLCVRKTLTEDVYIKTIKPVAPTGSHHSVLMLSPTSTGADGVTECNSGLAAPPIYASGVGSTELMFPDGIGLHAHAGDQLLLNLHLFNGSDFDLSGTSGIEYLPASAGEIQHEAASVLIGAANGSTVPVGVGVQLNFQCTTPPGLTIFAVAPHMHLLGSHLTASYTPASAAATPIIDVDYAFDDQKFRNITPFTTTLNGKYKVTCTWDNETGSPVTFGESTTNEMCFAMTYAYPPPPAPICGHQIP